MIMIAPQVIIQAPGGTLGDRMVEDTNQQCTLAGRTPDDKVIEDTNWQGMPAGTTLDGKVTKDIDWLGTPDGRKPIKKNPDGRMPVQRTPAKRMPDERMMMDTALDQLSILNDRMPVKSMTVSKRMIMEDYLNDSHPRKLTCHYRALNTYNYYGNTVIYVCR